MCPAVETLVHTLHPLGHACRPSSGDAVSSSVSGEATFQDAFLPGELLGTVRH